MKVQKMRINARRYGGAVIMWAGISLLALLFLPPTCWLIAAAIAMIITGYNLMRRRCGYRYKYK